MSIKPFKNFSSHVDIQTDTSIPIVSKRIHSSPLVCKTNFIKNISTKLLKDNKLNKRIFNQFNKQPSWCSVKLKNSDDKLQSTQQSLHSPSNNNSSINNYQQNQILSKSFSSSENINSDDLFYNPFINKLKNLSVVQKHNSFASSTDSNAEPFFPEKITTDYLSNYNSGSSKEYNLEISSTTVEQYKYCHFEHIFNWSENIEFLSPWTRNRSKEIFDHVNELFKAQKPEILKNDYEDISNDLKTEVVHDNSSSETNDNIIFEVANKLCDTLIKYNKTDNISDDHQFDNQCLLNDNLKWTNLYKKLIDYGQL